MYVGHWYVWWSFLFFFFYSYFVRVMLFKGRLSVLHSFMILVPQNSFIYLCYHTFSKVPKVCVVCGCWFMIPPTSNFLLLSAKWEEIVKIKFKNSNGEKYVTSRCFTQWTLQKKDKIFFYYLSTPERRIIIIFLFVFFWVLSMHACQWFLMGKIIILNNAVNVYCLFTLYKQNSEEFYIEFFFCFHISFA